MRESVFAQRAIHVSIHESLENSRSEILTIHSLLQIAIALWGIGYLFSGGNSSNQRINIIRGLGDSYD